MSRIPGRNVLLAVALIGCEVAPPRGDTGAHVGDAVLEVEEGRAADQEPDTGALAITGYRAGLPRRGRHDVVGEGSPAGLVPRRRCPWGLRGWAVTWWSPFTPVLGPGRWCAGPGES